MSLRSGENGEPGAHDGHLVQAQGGGREAGTAGDTLQGRTLEPRDSGLPGLQVAGVQCPGCFEVSLLTSPCVRGAGTGLGLAGASSLGQNGRSEGPGRWRGAGPGPGSWWPGKARACLCGLGPGSL